MRLLRSLLVTATFAPAAALLSQNPVVRDSAGVEILEYSRAPDPTNPLALSSRPGLDIGGESSDPSRELGRTIAAAVRLPDGSIAIADASTATIRFVSRREGVPPTSVGRRGGGPGEFQRPGTLYLLGGDTLGVTDGTRLQLLTPDGRFHRSERILSGILGLLDSNEWLRRQTVANPDSMIVWRAPRASSSDVAAPPGVRVAAFPRLVATSQTRGPSTTTVTTARGRATVTPILISAIPFAPGTEIAASRDGFFVGDARTFEIREYSATGSLRRIIRWDRDLRISRQDIDRYRQYRLGTTAGDARRDRERELAALELPPTMPAFDLFEVDATGRLWVRLYDPVPTAARTWIIAERDGRRLSALTLPPGATLLEPGRDYVILRSQDADGFMHVQLYGVTRVVR